MNHPNREEMQRLLDGALKLAQQNLGEAATALETAQLQAIAMNVPVLGRLHDEHDAARRRVVACQGALAAFQRKSEDEETGRQLQARADREAEIAASASEVSKAVSELVAAVEELMNKGAGAKMAHALDGMRRACSGASVSVLTDQGWITSDHLRELFSFTADHVVGDLIRGLLGPRLGALKATRHAEGFADQILAHTKAMPQGWPAA